MIPDTATNVLLVIKYIHFPWDLRGILDTKFSIVIPRHSCHYDIKLFV